MMNVFKSTLAISTLMLACRASAVQKDIMITADIEPTISLTRADGSELPSDITMSYLAGRGLKSHEEIVKLWSNSDSKNLNISLANAATLTKVGNNNSVIPLNVSLNNMVLSQYAQSFTYSSIFPNGNNNGSMPLPLVISQANQGPVVEAGRYTGLVSIVLTQATTAPTPTP